MRAKYVARTAVFNMIVGRFVQILRTTEWVCEDTTGLSGFANGLPESLGVL